jgi:hypothetical protein
MPKHFDGMKRVVPPLSEETDNPGCSERNDIDLCGSAGRVLERKENQSIKES